MSQNTADSDRMEWESEISESISQDLESQKPSDDRRAELRLEHLGHLVRETTSTLSMDVEVGKGFEAQATSEIPDMFCFTCDEWVGLSGVDLRGKPRSKSDAYYLGGMPDDVRSAKDGTQDTLIELADALEDRVGHISDRSDAFGFIETELEKLRSIKPDDD